LVYVVCGHLHSIFFPYWYVWSTKNLATLLSPHLHFIISHGPTQFSFSVGHGSINFLIPEKIPLFKNFLFEFDGSNIFFCAGVETSTVNQNYPFPTSSRFISKASAPINDAAANEILAACCR
jgi:hypothetical protein